MFQFHLIYNLHKILFQAISYGQMHDFVKWFEPKSVSSSSDLIVWVKVALKQVKVCYYIKQLEQKSASELS